MEIKKVWSVWFSGTGTTQKVATALSKQVAEGLQAQWEEYSFNLPAAREKELSFGPADLVVLGVPVYAGTTSTAAGRWRCRWCCMATGTLTTG